MHHLVRRFIGFVRARPLTPSEQADVAGALSPRLLRAFHAQPYQDQRHAYEVSRRVAARPELVEAALVHDLGKASSRLGAIGRSAATLWALTGLPVWGRWAAYLDHGAIGADILAAADADPLSIAFARHHPGPVPDGVDPAAWRALAAADDA